MNKKSYNLFVAKINSKKNEIRIRRKVEPFVWSYQSLKTLLTLSILGLLLGIVSLLSGKYVNYFFHYLIYPFAVFGQISSYIFQKEYYEIERKIDGFYLLSIVLFALIEAFFIWKYILLLYQFLVMFGLAATGLAFLGLNSGIRQIEKFGLKPPSKRMARILYLAPFIWFILYLLAAFTLPLLRINSQNFIHFSLAPAFSVLSSLNIGFFGGFVKESIKLKK
ncbi:MAG: hypothetical protein N2440_06265 [Actinobacteria bacterium]|nr:hypothetical protein [Actinomycetota bacterium]